MGSDATPHPSRSGRELSLRRRPAAAAVAVRAGSLEVASRERWSTFYRDMSNTAAIGFWTSSKVLY